MAQDGNMIDSSLRLATTKPPPEFISAEEIASLFSTSRKTVYSWGRRGLIKPVRIDGSRIVRFQKEEVYSKIELPQSIAENPPDYQKGIEYKGKNKLSLKTVDNWPELTRIGIKKMQLTKRKNVWQLSFYIDGKRYRKSLETSDYEEALLKISSEVANLLGISGLMGYSKPSKEAHTLAELLERYLNFKTGRVVDNTLVRYRESSKQLFAFFGSDRDIAMITQQGIEEFQSQRLMQGKSGATINRDITLLLSALKKAVQWEWLPYAPIQNVEKLRESESRDRVYSEDEIERLLGECSETLRPIVITALLTGMRRKEIRTLQWLDVDLEKKEIRLRNTKTHRNRTISINGKLLGSLFERLYIERKSDYVFTKSNGESFIQGFDKGFKAALERAGIMNACFHDLRRTCGTVLLELGESERVIQKLLGHTRIETTTRYLAVKDQRLRDAQQKLDTHFDTRLFRTKTGNLTTDDIS